MAAFTFSYTNETDITIVHGLDDPNPFWILYDSDGDGFFPDPGSPTVVDSNTMTFSFGSTPRAPATRCGRRGCTRWYPR